MAADEAAEADVAEGGEQDLRGRLLAVGRRPAVQQLVALEPLAPVEDRLAGDRDGAGERDVHAAPLVGPS